MHQLYAMVQKPAYEVRTILHITTSFLATKHPLASLTTCNSTFSNTSASSQVFGVYSFECFLCTPLLTTAFTGDYLGLRLIHLCFSLTECPVVRRTLAKGE